ncbi:hypothetical protein T484DRAFT_1908507 [Baffinella frigidus]|nr:hypothetical protein T484DRAFT_1908507 [Cryptophyta sp. CCMP2293]
MARHRAVIASAAAAASPVRSLLLISVLIFLFARWNSRSSAASPAEELLATNKAQLAHALHRAMPDSVPPLPGAAQYRQASLADEAFFPPATYGGVGGRSSVSISRGIQQTVRDRGATVRWGEVQEHKLRPHQVPEAYGGLGGRSRISVGNKIKESVRNKATVPPVWRDYAGEEEDRAMQEEAHVTATRVRKDGSKVTYRVTHVPGSVIDPAKILARNGTEEEEAEEEEERLKREPNARKIVLHVDPNMGVINETSSADEATKKYFREYTPPKRLEKEKDDCPPASECAMIRDLNAQHMGGLSPRGSERAHLNGPGNPAGQLQLGGALSEEGGGHGDSWSGTDGEEAAAARGNTGVMQREAEGRGGVTLCDICIQHALADAGPARFLVGRSIEARARQRRCAPLCPSGGGPIMPLAGGEPSGAGGGVQVGVGGGLISHVKPVLRV